MFDNKSIDGGKNEGPQVKAGPAQQGASVPGSSASNEEGRMEEVEVDFSRADPVLKEGLSTLKSRMGRKEEGGVASADEPEERIKNPFKQLSDISAKSNGGKVLLTRDVNGSWKTADGLTWGHAVPQDRTPIEPVHPDIVPPVGSDIVDKVLGTKPGESIALKTEVADYISKRDEARLWWLEKMKTPYNKHNAGAMLGVEVPERNAHIDHAMMMRQYGPGHLPSTTAEWEIHETMEQRRKYLRTLPTQPRYIKWSKRAVFGSVGGLFLLQWAWVKGNGHKADQSYRYSKAVDITERRNKQNPPYRSRSVYPYV
eukprot:TRINITY_DN4562_c5_g1_i1.p1 TRINITY_DN4562_c5_g1~~TRINITY_DN4562_c5_g1_i1.p1  ORF type:complete len:313 (+),score=35.50 TRINITY_DN4562_c5_g1_i1:64-1002(+)